MKVGAIVVKDNRVISIGYNGTPAGWGNICEDHVYEPDGFNINIKTQDRNVVENQDNIDPTTYGKYTIISARHIIGYDRHETVFEAVTDSLVSSNLEK